MFTLSVNNGVAENWKLGMHVKLAAVTREITSYWNGGRVGRRILFFFFEFCFARVTNPGGICIFN